MKNNTMYYWVGGALVVIGLLIGLSVYLSSLPGKYDGVATCLKDKGALFYGAFWCPHCQQQKAWFGRSAKLLPYVECSTADGKGQLPVCTDKKVESYPTWVFPDGTRETGEIEVAKLAEKMNCPLP